MRGEVGFFGVGDKVIVGSRRLCSGTTGTRRPTSIEGFPLFLRLGSPLSPPPPLGRARVRERATGLRVFVMCLRHRNHGPTYSTAPFFTRSISGYSAPEWPSVLWVSQHLVDPRSPAMSRGHQIDTLQDDRGLAACLSGSNVLPEWADAVIRAHKWETLEDFIFSVDEKDVTAAIQSLLAPTTFKENRLALQARLRAAYSAGAEAIKQAAQATKSSEGVDDPLPESTMEQLNRDFRSKYGSASPGL